MKILWNSPQGHHKFPFLGEKLGQGVNLISFDALQLATGSIIT